MDQVCSNDFEGKKEKNKTWLIFVINFIRGGR